MQRSVRLLAAALSLLGAAILNDNRAHAAPPCEGATPVADVVADANVRQRIVNIAVEEWRKFGFQVLDLSTNEWEADLTPLIGFTLPLEKLPRALLGMPKGRLMRIGFAERDPEISYAIRTYWSALVRDERSLDRVTPATAWSSAFVSWVMCRAGFSDTQFRRRDAHVFYVAAAFNEEAVNGVSPMNRYAYLARPVRSTPVHAGDLVCFSDESLTFEQRRAISRSDDWRGRGQGSHCDIVVGFNGGRVLAIGGNVQQSVTMSVFAARRDGDRVYLMTPTEWRAARPFYAIMSLRARPDLAGGARIPYGVPNS